MASVWAQYCRHFWVNTLLICFWGLFAYSSGGWWGGWAPPWVGYHRWWWYDDVGHSLYGFVGGFTLLHFIINYTARGAFLFVGRGMVTIIVLAMVLAGAGLFELYEFIWDEFLKPPERFRGQNGLRDTMIDVWNALWAVAFLLFLWHMGRSLYRRIWPVYAEKEERSQTADDILEASERIRELRRRHWKEVRDKFRRKIRQQKKIL